MKLIILSLLLSTYAFGNIEIKVDIKGTPAEIARITAIVPGVERVINSEAFKKRVLESTFTSTKDSNKAIYQKIMAGNWRLKYEFKNKSFFWKCSRVKGWTYKNTPTVWFNSCGFNNRKDSGLAGTMAHEEMHKRGYGHKSAKDLMSVPYSIGNIVAELYGKED